MLRKFLFILLILSNLNFCSAMQEQAPEQKIKIGKTYKVVRGGLFDGELIRIKGTCKDCFEDKYESFQAALQHLDTRPEEVVNYALLEYLYFYIYGLESGTIKPEDFAGIFYYGFLIKENIEWNACVNPRWLEPLKVKKYVYFK